MARTAAFKAIESFDIDVLDRVSRPVHNAILLCLEHNDKMTSSQVYRMLGTTYSYTNIVLNALVKEELVYKVIPTRNDSKREKYYKLTKKGDSYATMLRIIMDELEK